MQDLLILNIEDPSIVFGTKSYVRSVRRPLHDKRIPWQLNDAVNSVVCSVVEKHVLLPSNSVELTIRRPSVMDGCLVSDCSSATL